MTLTEQWIQFWKESGKVMKDAKVVGYKITSEEYVFYYNNQKCLKIGSGSISLENYFVNILEDANIKKVPCI